MSDKIKVNVDRLEVDADSIREYVDTISDCFAELSEKKSQLDRMWEGPASNNFNLAFDDDLKTLITMINNLYNLYDYANISKQRYQLCERQISDLISEL